jgi:hypothetical protein
MGQKDSVIAANEKLARQINCEARQDPKSPYAGKLVGIANGQVVVVADTWREVAERLIQVEPDSAKCFCIEASADYERLDEIWGMVSSFSAASIMETLGTRALSHSIRFPGRDLDVQCIRTGDPRRTNTGLTFEAYGSAKCRTPGRQDHGSSSPDSQCMMLSAIWRLSMPGTFMPIMLLGLCPIPETCADSSAASPMTTTRPLP